MALFLVAAATAIYSPTRYALLPAAAADTRLPSVRHQLDRDGRRGRHCRRRHPRPLISDDVAWPGEVSAAIAVAFLFGLAALLTALPVHFDSDVTRPEPPLRAVAGFFRDARRVFANRPVRRVCWVWPC